MALRIELYSCCDSLSKPAALNAVSLNRRVHASSPCVCPPSGRRLGRLAAKSFGINPLIAVAGPVVNEIANVSGYPRLAKAVFARNRGLHFGLFAHGHEPASSEVTMEILSKIAIGAAGIALFSAAAFADEVTTTTTQRTQDPGPGVYVGVPGVVGVQVGAPPSGCTTQSRTTTDTNTGDSRSVTRSNC